MRWALLLALFTAALYVSAHSADTPAAPDSTDTRLLHMPAVSKDHIAFVYADDLWVCDLDGKNVRRLTTDVGLELSPVFSPDGRTIAFSATYNGHADVYTIPVTGGVPRRLTAHPGGDIVRGWAPDGKAVLFGSQRETFAPWHMQLFTVPVGGGFPNKLPIPHGWEASYSPDGTRIAYTPQGDRSGQWKHYRGGTHSRIWVMGLKDLAVEQVPQPAGRCNDTDPRWMGETVYFRSDRNGEFNLFAYDTKTRAVRQFTEFTDFPVISLNVGGGNLVFEQAGYLHRFDVGKRKSMRLKIAVAADLPETRARFAKGKGLRYLRNDHISPSGARVALEFRGEIVTVPAEKGDPRNLTNTPGAHERSPVWSPDGQSIAYFSDDGGEYALHVRPADGKGKAKVYKLTGAGYYEAPSWSPDSKKIAYVDNAWTLYWLDLASGTAKKVAAEPIYGPANQRSLWAAWSPDSNWIAYALGNLSAYRTLYLYSLAEGRSQPITDGLSDATEPVFDAGGKYLYFFASTDAGPVNNWFNQSRIDMRATRSLYVAVLPKGLPSPFARESDEEKPKPDQPEGKKKEPVTIDFDGLDRRVVPFPLPAGDYRQLRAGAAGQVFYLAQQPTLPGQSGPPQPDADALRPGEAQGRHAAVERDRLPRHARRQEGPDRYHLGDVVHRRTRPRPGRQQGQAEHGGHRGPGRSPGRVAADLRRGLADQPRLLL